MYGNAFRTMSMGGGMGMMDPRLNPSMRPGQGFGSPGGMGGGFNMPTVGGRVDPTMPPTPDQGGGWGERIKGVLGGLTSMEGAYLGASALAGAGDYFEQRAARKQREREFDETLEERRKHRESMGRSWNATYGGG